jgi:hypothetical protein
MRRLRLWNFLTPSYLSTKQGRAKTPLFGARLSRFLKIIMAVGHSDSRVISIFAETRAQS